MSMPIPIPAAVQAYADAVPDADTDADTDADREADRAVQHEHGRVVAYSAAASQRPTVPCLSCSKANARADASAAASLAASHDSCCGSAVCANKQQPMSTTPHLHTSSLPRQYTPLDTQRHGQLSSSPLSRSNSISTATHAANTAAGASADTASSSAASQSDSSAPALAHAPAAASTGASCSLKRSFTHHQLAQDAVHVRDAAKWIGRAFVKLERPRAAMIIAKALEPAFVLFTRQLAIHLIDTPRECANLDGLVVFVEERFRDHPVFDYQRLAATRPNFKDKLRTWTPEFCATNPDAIDFIVTLGGDGTVLYAAWLFQKTQVPPVIPFHLGSLGFLTVFDITDIRNVLERIVGCTSDGVRVNMRMRLNCTVHRHSRNKADKASLISSSIVSPYSSHRASVNVADANGAKINSPDPTVNIAHALAATHLSQGGSSQGANRSAQLLGHLGGSGPHKAHRNGQDSNFGSDAQLNYLRDNGGLPVQDSAGTAVNSGSKEGVDGTNSSGHSIDAGNLPSSSPHRTARSEVRLSADAVATESFQILNDLVVDRGPSPYMSQLELFVEDKHLTTVQADGLVVATPTGSTAYSLSAGGSLVHPEVPSFLITPICAHTLSFRPMLLPDSIVLKLQVPLDSRNTAWASFDGRHRTELRQGDYISVTMSRWPMPSVCMEDQSSDWFESLRRCLHWNERARQKPFGIPGDIDTSVTDAELGADGSLESPSVGQVSLEDMAVRLFNLGRL